MKPIAARRPPSARHLVRPRLVSPVQPGLRHDRPDGPRRASGGVCAAGGAGVAAAVHRVRGPALIPRSRRRARRPTPRVHGPTASRAVRAPRETADSAARHEAADSMPLRGRGVPRPAVVVASGDSRSPLSALGKASVGLGPVSGPLLQPIRAPTVSVEREQAQPASEEFPENTGSLWGGVWGGDPRGQSIHHVVLGLFQLVLAWTLRPRLSRPPDVGAARRPAGPVRGRATQAAARAVRLTPGSERRKGRARVGAALTMTGNQPVLTSSASPVVR